ncbi:hypothetical protein BC830DRAFT_1166447 [Chytriomyces sp. MP71]|nr:hypothetical protein BC830DRAFT_1166447 [Chytriomyces sp. MP71]
MTRKSDNKGGNATVAAIQQTHATTVQSAKVAATKPATPQQKTMSAPAKPTTPQQKSVSKPSTQSFAAAAAKPATPQSSKVQAAPSKAPQQVSAASKKPVIYSKGPDYEALMTPGLFAEPMSWTKNQAPCHAPHLAPRNKVLSKQNSVNTPQPVAQPIHNKEKMASKQGNATKKKAAVKWNSPAGKQLILRPKLQLVLYKPLWVQVQEWSNLKNKPRGRSANQATKQERIQQHKQRLAAQRKPEQIVAPKQQPNSAKPLSHQASNLKSKPATTVKQSASSGVDWHTNVWEDFYTSKHSTLLEQNLKSELKPNTPALKSQSTHVSTKKGTGNLKSNIAPPKEAKSPEIFSFIKDSPTTGPVQSPSPINERKYKPAQIPLRPVQKQYSASSPTGGQPDVFATYIVHSDPHSVASSRQASRQTPVAPLSPSKQYAAIRAAKPKPTPYMNGAMPREMANHWSEGSNYINLTLLKEAEERGITWSAQPKQKVNKKKPQTSPSKVKKQNSFGSWFTPSSIAVASAAVVIGGVGLGALLN